jgi:hypothetical protein
MCMHVVHVGLVLPVCCRSIVFPCYCSCGHQSACWLQRILGAAGIPFQLNNH